jgi:hypothetical protein
VGLFRTLVAPAILGTAGIGGCDAESEPALSPRAGEASCPRLPQRSQRLGIEAAEQGRFP